MTALDVTTDASDARPVRGSTSLLKVACTLAGSSIVCTVIDGELGLGAVKAPEPLLQRLRRAIATERHAVTALRAAQADVRDALLDARRQGVSYDALARGLVPATGSVDVTLRTRARVSAALRARAWTARRITRR